MYASQLNVAFLINHQPFPIIIPLSRCIIFPFSLNFSLFKMKNKLLFDFCSQPPLLSSMIFDIYNRTGDVDFVKNSLPALLKEYEFWNSGGIKVFSFLDCCIFSGCSTLFCLSTFELHVLFEVLLIFLGSFFLSSLS